MLPLVAFGLLHAQQATVASVENCRPSRLVSDLLRLLPEARVEADDRNGNLLYYGPSDRVDEFRAMVKLFDVTPRTLRVRIEVDSPADHYHGKTVVQIANLREWSMDDPYLGYTLRIMGRLGNDGTIMLVAHTKTSGHAQTVSFRLREGEPFWIRPGVLYYTDAQRKRLELSRNGADNQTIGTQDAEFAAFKKAWDKADRDFIPILRIDANALDHGQTWSEAPGFTKK